MKLSKKAISLMANRSFYNYYSCLKAWMTSIFVALRAGLQPESNATPILITEATSMSCHGICENTISAYWN